MIREIRAAAFTRRLTPVGWRYHLVLGDTASSANWSARRQRQMHALQRTEPVTLFELDERAYWWFEDRVYREDEALAADDVLALVREGERRRRRRLERAHARLATERAAPRRRERIPHEVRLAVFARDGGRCADCGSNFDLQYDHVIPVALGGASTLENLQVLCATCNRRKGAGVT